MRLLLAFLCALSWGHDYVLTGWDTDKRVLYAICRHCGLQRSIHLTSEKQRLVKRQLRDALKAMQ